LECNANRLRLLASAGLSQAEEQRWRAAGEGRELREHLATRGASGLTLSPLRLGSQQVGALGIDHVTSRSRTSAERTLFGGIEHLATLVLQRDRLLRERDEALARELTLQDNAQRMDEFLATAGHDLRSPLTAVVGTIDLAAVRFGRLMDMLTDLTLGPAVAKALDRVRLCLQDAAHSAERLTQLVELLFDTSQARSGTFELRRTRCDLVGIVRDQIEGLRASRPIHKLRLDVPPEEVVILADRVRLGQVIANYLTNAVKYSKPGSSIAVHVDVEGAKARVAVRDQGIGLPADQRDLIWQRFYRVPDIQTQNGESTGLGLGLYICKKIVEAHGGQVGVESKVGKGSNFWLTIPLADGD
jgi:signal transduction histidine kinase